MAPAHETPVSGLSGFYNSVGSSLIDFHQDDGVPDIHEYADLIDGDTFEQILEMDDDEEDRDFSKGIVYGFFEQAESTFENMDKAL